MIVHSLTVLPNQVTWGKKEASSLLGFFFLFSFRLRRTLNDSPDNGLRHNIIFTATLNEYDSEAHILQVC